MSSLTIRNLDDNVKQSLRQRAAARGVSMEEEARFALRNWVKPGPAPSDEGLGTRLRNAFADLGGVELELPVFSWGNERMWGLTALIFDLILRRYAKLST